MLFNSIDFIFFLPIVVGIYYLLPHKYRWILLLISSYYFYMCWKAEYAILILISTVVDYFVGWEIHKSTTKARKKRLLFLSLFTNLGLLFFFKYTNFFSENLNFLLGAVQPEYQIPYMEILLPVGISFYTFQTLSYTIDIYRGNIEPEKHFGRFAVFVSFWPQLVAGPIERAANLLPQFRKPVNFSYENAVVGLNLIVYGLFKKIVVADRVAIYSNEVFNAPGEASMLSSIIGTFFFAIQIYCDFSGYSDVAIGSARIMGIDLMYNFRRPYLSKSVAEFWRRWHISLSTWFKDYVYIPLGGNRVVKWRMYYNLFFTFLVSGLWHGANWTFVIWGAIHGGVLIFERVRKEGFQKLGWTRIEKTKMFSLGGWLATMLVVYFAWIFFRAEHLSDAWIIIGNIMGLGQGSGDLFMGKGVLNLAISFLVVALLFLSYRLPYKLDFYGNKSVMFIVTCIIFIILFGTSGEQEFIYFQF